MSETTVPVYQHSGRCALSSLVVCLLVMGALVIPAAFAYSGIVYVVPWDILAIVATLVFGFLCGLVCTVVVKKRKIRNNVLAGWIGLITGVMALYWSWVACIFFQFDDGLVLLPQDIWSKMQYVYEYVEQDESNTGFDAVLLAVFWVLEALVICGLSWIVVLAEIGDTPFCEKEEVWLNEQQTIDTLSLFSDHDIELLSQGNLQPLLQARARHVNDPAWTRIILKYSDLSNETFTMRMLAVHLKQNKEGELEEESTEITQDLLLDSSAFKVIKQFAELEPLDEEQSDLNDGNDDEDVGP